MDSECNEIMVNTNIDNFEISYEESASYFKHLENMGNIRRTSSLVTLPADNKKIISSAISVGNFSKNHKSSNLWCCYSDKKELFYVERIIANYDCHLFQTNFKKGSCIPIWIVTS
jgi:hypothetical protein